MSKLNAGTRVKLTGSGWSGPNWGGRIVTALDSPTSVASGVFVVPAEWGYRGGQRYYLHDGDSYWGYELVDGVERTYSTDEIVSAIRSLTEAGVGDDTHYTESFIGCKSPYGRVSVSQWFEGKARTEQLIEWWEAKGFTVTVDRAMDKLREGKW